MEAWGCVAVVVMAIAPQRNKLLVTRPRVRARVDASGCGVGRRAARLANRRRRIAGRNDRRNASSDLDVRVSEARWSGGVAGGVIACTHRLARFGARRERHAELDRHARENSGSCDRPLVRVKLADQGEFPCVRPVDDLFR